MSGIVIEVGEIQVGLIIKERRGFRFFVADKRVHSLEGRFFRSAIAATSEAERTLASHLSSKIRTTTLNVGL
jgi:hypothetical protein